MIAAIPLIADASDVIGVVVFLVILIISAISQAIGKAKEAQQQQRPRPPVRPAGPAPNPQDPVVRELDEFLRRAAAGGKAQPKPARPRQQAAPVRPQPQAARPVAPRAPAAPKAPPVLVAQPVLAQAAEELEEIRLEPAVTDRLSQAADQRLSSQKEQSLGAGVAQAQRQMSQKLSEDFSHKVGRLAGAKQDAATELPATAAAGLAAMLASPVDVRQAILLSEILQRPEHRWR